MNDDLAPARVEPKASELPPAKILLVDDQPKNLLALSAMLEPLGQEVVQASSGKEALRYLLRDEFALVLLDVQMPVLDGYEVAELIRGRERSRAVPIIFLTAIHRDQRLVARAYSVGAVDYILKPIDPEILRSKVAVFIELYQKGQIISRQAEELKRATEREFADFRRVSEYRYTMLAESMPQIVWTTDRSGALSYGNGRWFECAGLPETAELSWSTIVHPGEHSEFTRGFVDALAEERAWEAEFRLGNVSERRFRWHLVRMLPERDASGAVTAWVGTCTDIDARKRAEQALQMLASLTRRLGELTDRSHGLDEVLAATLPVLGESAALYLRSNETVTKRASASLSSALNLDDPRFDLAPSTVCFDGEPEIVRNVAESLAQSGSRAGEQVWFLHELGVSSYICWPLFIRDRVFGSLVFLNRDPERHYLDSDVELAKDVAGRMATALDNVGLYELAQSERAKLQEANRAKDMFLATVSHELRTPLNAIVGWGQMLRGGGLSHETEQRAVDTIERNGRALAQLVADLLDVSRVVSGNLHVDAGQVDLRAIVDAALDAARPVAATNGVALEAELPDVPLNTLGDSTRLQQVVGNILGNALKFTPRGGHVNLTLVVEGEIARLEIADDGPGIAPEFLPVMFDRFKQADNGTHRAQRGLGLGLAIVKHLVELHGGTVTAHSEGLGKGACFVVTLPLGVPVTAGDSADASPAPAREPVPAPTPQNERGALSGIYALLVEDDPDGCDLMQMMLRRFGAEVTAVSTAAAALESVRERRPDVLVSDIGLPDGDGFQLLKRVRESNQDLPAVAVTAYASRQDVAKALAAGFQAHVAKPVEPAQLSAAVAHASGR
ncbi:MAG TPA: response regulator [Polyangiaceae bacterium]|nr:response regulator [Polyangiaceae bacterium]